MSQWLLKKKKNIYIVRKCCDNILHLDFQRPPFIMSMVFLNMVGSQIIPRFKTFIKYYLLRKCDSKMKNCIKRKNFRIQRLWFTDCSLAKVWDSIIILCIKVTILLNYAIYNNISMLYMFVTFKKIFAKQLFCFIKFKICF